MELFLNGQTYSVRTEENTLTSSIEGMLPFTLKLSRSADHEYYTSLPQTASVDGAEGTSYVKAGWIYYFKDWNAFALNFKEANIAPYKVYVIGEVSGGIERMLDECGQCIEVTVR